MTRASGRSICITHRQIKNNRLANVGWMWAFSAASTHDAARATTDNAATTATDTPPPTDTSSNKLLGQLYHCLQTRQRFDAERAFGSADSVAAA